MPFIEEPMVIWSGVPLATRINILNMKIQASKKSQVDYVECSGYWFNGGF